MSAIKLDNMGHIRISAAVSLWRRPVSALAATKCTPQSDTWRIYGCGFIIPVFKAARVGTTTLCLCDMLIWLGQKHSELAELNATIL
ncbi:hypothetical protein BaRGS_00040037 [Batillaria attramentaria]|uniref:Uncharacterized protein n=1 Tax=Batillaria attramentaria TaxID=370345 RepID=A0ABD0J1D6_9CAEN